MGRALEGFLREAGLLKVSREKLCAVIWSEVAGTWYARFTAVTRVADGILYVRCDSAPRAQQLQLDAPEIIRRLNERLGGELVKEIRPSSAGSAHEKSSLPRPPQAPPAPTEAELALLELSAEELERVRAEAQQVKDPKLRERVEAILIKQTRVRRWQADHGYTRCEGCGAYITAERRFCLACRPPPPPRAVDDTAGPEWDRDAPPARRTRARPRPRRGRRRRG